MRESIGSAYLYNIIIIFLFIVFGFAGALITYQKAYKVNSKIALALEEAEGYNDISIAEINRNLGNLGYRVNSGKKCKEMDGSELITSVENTPKFDYCVYRTRHDTHDQYMIITYIYLDFPFIDEVRFPIKSKTSIIYNFSKWEVRYEGID